MTGRCSQANWLVTDRTGVVFTKAGLESCLKGCGRVAFNVLIAAATLLTPQMPSKTPPPSLLLRNGGMEIVLVGEVFFGAFVGLDERRNVRFAALSVGVQLVNVHLVHTQGTGSCASERVIEGDGHEVRLL